MTGQLTSRPSRITEHYKARARVVLLTLVGLICPPLAGVRSIAVWVFYLLFLVAYSLWSLRLARNFSGDRRLGYLLSLTDTAILLPILVWTSANLMRVILAALFVSGFVFSNWADRAAMRSGNGISARTDDGAELDASSGLAMESGLESALRVRLRVFQTTHTRFALIVLRILRFDEMTAYYGEEASQRTLGIVIRRGLRLLGADAQYFILPGGRVAYVFSTGSGSTRSGLQADNTFELVDPYDIESFAMNLGRKACEHLIDGHRVECVVGWAAAPADGLNSDDLMYSAESGAQSTAAFRRVGSTVPVSERTRIAAG